MNEYDRTIRISDWNLQSEYVLSDDEVLEYEKFKIDALTKNPDTCAFTIVATATLNPFHKPMAYARAFSPKGEDGWQKFLQHNLTMAAQETAEARKNR